MRIWGMTDIGLVRRENQDAYAFREVAGHAVCVVCDGMGGPAGGQIASRIAVETYIGEIEKLLRTGMELHAASRYAVSLANRAIWMEAKRRPNCAGMGTTLVAAISSGAGAAVTNVGDSRAYLISQRGITLITRDHSLVQNMVDRGDITPEEARIHPNRNVITRALGPDEDVECDSFFCPMEPGSSLLLCSDGLINTVTDEEMLREIRRGDGEEALSRLLALALERGAPDNVTAVLMERA